MRDRTQELIKLRHEQLINPSAAVSKLRDSETKLAPLNLDLFFEPSQRCETQLGSTTQCELRLKMSTANMGASLSDKTRTSSCFMQDLF